MTQHQLCQYIVKKFVKPENINWPAQIKIAKRLLKFEPNEKFWLDLNIGFLCNNLAYFLTGVGKSKLVAEKNKFYLAFEQKKEYTFEDKKIGADKEFDKKPKTLIDLF